MSPESQQSRFDRQIVAFTRRVIQWRWAVIIATFLLVMLAGRGATGLFFDTEYRAFFGEDNPELQAFEELQNVYTKNDNILFVVSPENGAIFSPEHLEAIEKLTSDAWQLPFSIRVDAVTNYQHTYSEEDDLIVADLIANAGSLPDSALAAAKAVALKEPLLRKRLVNPDASVTGVNVTLQLPGKSAEEVPQTVAAARALADQIRSEYPDLAIRLTGIAMLNNAFMETSQQDMGSLMPLMFLAMILIMIFSLRSISGTVATLFLLMLSVVTAMGVAGYYNVGLTPPSAQAPLIILTLSIADSIHILVSMLREMKRGLSKYEAIVESIRLNFMPVFLTSISTVIGFLSLNFSDVPPFNHLGNITSVGVMAAFILSITFLPALMSVLPVRVKVKDENETGGMERFAGFVISQQKPLLYGTAAIMLLLVALIPLNQLDDRFVEYFDTRVDFRNDTDYTSQNLTGIYQIEYSLSGGEEGSISDPEYLQAMESFAEWFRMQPGVDHVSTFTDIIKRLNFNMHNDDPAYYRLPDSRDLAAQYLLLYEMSLPYGLDLNNQVNVDKSATRFIVTVQNMSAIEIQELAETGESWLQKNAPVSMHSAKGSGPVLMFSHISGVNIRSMMIGTIAALIVISLMMIFALRSLRLGLLSFIPNLFPAAVAFGIWGLTSGVINLGLSVVIGLTMGIVVDDSIHFLSKYLRARREKGLSASEAVYYAFANVGRALTVTTVILVIGFLILSTSAFDMNASLGRMTAITLGLALAIDFLFLPPLLMLLDRDKTTETKGALS